MATRESSLTIAACFRRILLSLQWHSMALSNNSASISLSLTSLFPSPSPPPSFSKYYLHKSASSCPPFLSLFLSSNLHSIPLLSSLHSTPKYCNFSLVATTALQLRNDKFLACLPCLASPPFLAPTLVLLPTSPFRQQAFCVSSAVKLVHPIDSID